MWFMEEPSQFSMGQTAQSLACSIAEKPHAGLDDCLNMLLACFRKMMSASFRSLPSEDNNFPIADRDSTDCGRKEGRNCNGLQKMVWHANKTTALFWHLKDHRKAFRDQWTSEIDCYRNTGTEIRTGLIFAHLGQHYSVLGGFRRASFRAKIAQNDRKPILKPLVHCSRFHYDSWGDHF